MDTAEVPAIGTCGALRDSIYAGERMHVTLILVDQNPRQLLRRRMTPTHMQLHGNLLGVRRATIRRIPQGSRPTGRERAKGFKLIRAILRVGHMKLSIREIRAFARKCPFEI